MWQVQCYKQTNNVEEFENETLEDTEGGMVRGGMSYAVSK